MVLSFDLMGIVLVELSELAFCINNYDREHPPARDGLLVFLGSKFKVSYKHFPRFHAK